MRTESFIAPAIFGVIVVLGSALVLSSRDVSSRGMAVADANTVRYHIRRIRVVGLDTPELNGHCEEEICWPAGHGIALRS
jgi:hypothetical protein